MWKGALTVVLVTVGTMFILNYAGTVSPTLHTAIKGF